MSDPPSYGFRPEYSPSVESATNYRSGIELSYPMPMPYGDPKHLAFEHRSRKSSSSSSCSSSSSSSSSSGESYHIKENRPILPPLGYLWHRATIYSGFPYGGAVRAGVDQDGTQIYIGRAYHEGDLIPCKIIPDKQAAYIAYGGQEILKEEFEVLRTGDISWQFATNGDVPPGAIEVGRTADGEPLFAGRCMYEGSQTPGKIQRSHGCLYIPFDGQEISIKEYEVLVLN